MSGKTKFVVVLGALLGVIGVFLPLASVSGQGDGGGMLGLGVSLWSGAPIVGAGFLAWAFLAGFALAAVFAVLGIANRFGRGLAVGALLTSLLPGAVSVFWLTQALSLNATGIGLVLLSLGGILAVVGSIAALVKPERAPVVRTARTAAALSAN